ncbi:MAG: hypothetical protein M1816_001733 [Peltula sp. TS41687]|nr:MAG: hypothetical protein M1816_001733 [Peltula sp. TS41687]
MTSLSTRLYPRPLPFPSYLFRPHNPFRKRPSPSVPPANLTPTSTSTTGLTSPPYLTGHTSYLRCARCSTDLCLTSQIISKGFTGRHGRAYLVCANPNSNSNPKPGDKPATQGATLPNTLIHKAVPRQLVTGAHTVSDISCEMCGAVLGWKYVAAEDEAQRYKVGKFILETRKVRVGRCWEEEEEEDEEQQQRVEEEDGIGGQVGRGQKEKEREREAEVVEFDSQDEEECDDLFAGVWSPALAARRRRGKKFG